MGPQIYHFRWIKVQKKELILIYGSHLKIFNKSATYRIWSKSDKKHHCLPNWVQPFQTRSLFFFFTMLALKPNFIQTGWKTQILKFFAVGRYWLVGLVVQEMIAATFNNGFMPHSTGLRILTGVCLQWNWDYDKNAFFKSMFYHSKGLKIDSWPGGPHRQSGGSER